MTPLEHVQQVFAELGPNAEEVATVAQEPDGKSWVIELEDETIVNVELEPEQQRLAFTVGLPKPPADRRTETYEALLTYNLLWQGSVPLRIAMDEPDGEILQVAEISAAGLDVAALKQALSSVVEAARLWRPVIAAGCAAPVVAAPAENSGLIGMRV